MDMRSAEVSAERRKTELEIKSLLEKFRAGDVRLPATPSDLATTMSTLSRGTNNPSSLAVSATWRQELMYLLRAQSTLPITNLARLVGISFSQLPKHRRADHELDQAIRDYQSAWFEAEVENPSGHIHPTLVQFGLKARAGWMEAKDQAISLDELSGFIDKVGSILEQELRGYPDLLSKISDRILKAMPNDQGNIIDVVAEVRP